MSYSLDLLEATLDALGIQVGDNIYCHANLGLFGKLENCNSSSQLAQTFYENIRCRIGASGTLVLPSYTYSFCTGNNFDLVQTPSKMGILSEHARKILRFSRTRDPLLSVLVQGPLEKEFCSALINICHGPNSHFGLVHSYDFKILCLNHFGNTFLHYIERQLKVAYRFDKSFYGKYVEPTNSIDNMQANLWVRILEDRYQHSPRKFHTKSTKSGVNKYLTLGNGFITIGNAKNIYDLVSCEINKNKSFLLV